VKRGMKKIDALLALINDLLDVARLEAGRLVQKQTAIDLSEMIEDMVLLMQLRAKEQGIVLTHSCENMKPVVADPKNIEEVLNNLLTNAINYSPEGGKVTVTARGVGQFVEIKVSDTGVGSLPRSCKDLRQVLSGETSKTRQVTARDSGFLLSKALWKPIADPFTWKAFRIREPPSPCCSLRCKESRARLPLDADQVGNGLPKTWC